MVGGIGVGGIVGYRLPGRKDGNVNGGLFVSDTSMLLAYDSLHSPSTEYCCFTGVCHDAPGSHSNAKTSPDPFHLTHPDHVPAQPST